MFFPQWISSFEKAIFWGGIWMIQPLSLVFLNVLGNLPNNTKPPPTELPSNDHSPNAIISQAGWCLMSDEESWAFWMTIFSIKWSVQMRNWFGGGSHQPARNKAFVLGLWSPPWSLNNPWKKRPAISCSKKTPVAMIFLVEKLPAKRKNSGPSFPPCWRMRASALSIQA